eukprot:7595857-Ditylum_brightwellii.AAC.1
MPKRQDSAYLKLWNPELQLTLGWEAGVPKSTQIVEDMVLVVHSCGTRRGHRQDGTRKVQNWGGCRDKKSFSGAFIHSNVLSTLDESLQSSTATWMGGQNLIGQNVENLAVNNDHVEDDDEID